MEARNLSHIEAMEALAYRADVIKRLEAEKSVLMAQIEELEGLLPVIYPCRLRDESIYLSTMETHVTSEISVELRQQLYSRQQRKKEGGDA